MKLPGREPLLVELAPNEYSALKGLSESEKVSMTVIVRDLVSQYLMKDTLIDVARLSKRRVKFAEEKKEPVVIHFADDEYDFLQKVSEKQGSTMTSIVRNLIRKHIMKTGPVSD